jgi:phage repressor protein C with HTH and peptisase S24 domain
MFTDWLKQALKDSGMGQAELARRLTAQLGRSIDRAAVNKMASGKRSISADELVSIASILKVDAPSGSITDARTDQDGPSEGYRVDENVVYEGPATLPPRDGPRDIQELGITVGGFGDDDDAFELNGQVIDMVKRPYGILNRQGVFALRVSNDSMAPKYEDGDRVYVEKRKPAIRDYVVIELKPTAENRPGKSFIKRLVSANSEVVVVEQFNPRGRLEFETREIKQTLRVIPEKELRGE